MEDYLIWMCPLKPICNGCCPVGQIKQMACYQEHHSQAIINPL